MLFNGVKMSSNTASGTADFAGLTAVTGYPTFAAFPAATRSLPMSYCITDSSGLPLEWGLGYYDHTNTKIVRQHVLSTYSGGVYDDTSPTALTLSSGTTYYIFPTRESSVAMELPPTIRTSAGTRAIGCSRYSGNTNNNVTPPLNRLQYVPFFLEYRSEISGLGFRVTGAGDATAVARVGIYRITPAGEIGDIIDQTGDISVSTTGFKSGTMSSSNVFLTPGVYAIGYCCKGTTAAQISARVAGVGWNNMFNLFGSGDANRGLGTYSAPLVSAYETYASAFPLPTTPGTLTYLDGYSYYTPAFVMVPV